MSAREYFNRLAGDYDTLAAAAGYRSAEWLDALLETLPACPQAVDFACARGLLGRRIRARFPAVQLVGVDLADQMVAAAAATGAYDSVLQHDLNEPLDRLGDCQFTLAVALGFTEFLPRPEVFLAEAARVLAPGGTLLVSFLEHRPVAPEAGGRHVSGQRVPLHAYTRDTAAGLLRAQGLRPVQMQALVGWVGNDGAPRPYVLVQALRG